MSSEVVDRRSMRAQPIHAGWGARPASSARKLEVPHVSNEEPGASGTSEP